MNASTMTLLGRAVTAATLAGGAMVSSVASAQAYPQPAPQQGGYYGDQSQYGQQQQPSNNQPQYNGQNQYNGQPQYNGQAQYNSQPQYNGQPQYNDQRQYNDQQQYNGRQQDGYDEVAQANRNSPPPPPGYDGSQLPPPPPGYRQDAGYADQTQQDRRYEAYAEDWSQRYCTKARSNAGAGAVIGGLFGALLGSSVSGRHDRGTGALVGGLAGAAGGAVVGGSTAGDTSPGCPPGYVVRGGAPSFTFATDTGPYYYAAPEWYRPWFFYEGRWTYRPYPYHTFYYRNYGYGHGYGRGGYGYRGGRYRRY